jgi:fumarylacetoacetate (FAA) hydrolase family protein
MQDQLTTEVALPRDGTAGTLIGRAWVPGGVPGPSPVAIRAGGVFDLAAVVPTVSELLNASDPLVLARSEGRRIGDLAAILANSAHDRRDPALPHLLAPADLQAIKASGVTFATSMLERVIEEQAGGDPAKAEAIRATLAILPRPRRSAPPSPT